MADLKESKISSENVYKGSFLDIRKDRVTLPDGKTSTREWIKHPGAATTVCPVKINSSFRPVTYC